MMQFLQDYLLEYDNLDDYDVMILGDFNLPNILWPGKSLISGSPRVMQHSAESLTDFMDRNFLNQHVTENTRDANILDLFITNNESLVLDINVSDTPLSDYRKIEILLQNHPAYTPIISLKKLDEKSFRSLKLDAADWPTINKELSQVDWESLRSDCPQKIFLSSSALHYFTSASHTALRRQSYAESTNHLRPDSAETLEERRENSKPGLKPLSRG